MRSSDRVTIDDALGLREISDVHPSPNGEWIAYVVTRGEVRPAVMDSACATEYTHLWVAPLSEEAGLLTTGPGHRLGAYNDEVWHTDPSGEEAPTSLTEALDHDASFVATTSGFPRSRASRSTRPSSQSGRSPKQNWSSIPVRDMAWANRDCVGT